MPNDGKLANDFRLMICSKETDIWKRKLKQLIPLDIANGRTLFGSGWCCLCAAVCMCVCVWLLSRNHFVWVTKSEYAIADLPSIHWHLYLCCLNEASAFECCCYVFCIHFNTQIPGWWLRFYIDESIVQFNRQPEVVCVDQSSLYIHIYIYCERLEQKPS